MKSSFLKTKKSNSILRLLRSIPTKLEDKTRKLGLQELKLGRMETTKARRKRGQACSTQTRKERGQSSCKGTQRFAGIESIFVCSLQLVSLEHLNLTLLILQAHV